ncbi:DUF397 domain-containing protein [Streptomyces violascens]|uniref:DUF397 domain-containing protein n=1 Tax=Streptomyces violascens TaxID=67381 RepID=UPI00364EE64A
MQVANGVAANEIPGAVWVKSRASAAGNCVEIARLQDGAAVRNSRFPDGPALIFTEAEMRAFVAGARAGDFGF